MRKEMGFLGCGKMAGAIVDAVIKRNIDEINLFDVNADALKKFDKTARVYNSAQEMINASEYVFIGVKPQDAKTVLAGLDFTGKVVISMMASVSIECIRAYTNYKTEKIVRIMPNLNARFQEAYTGYCFDGLTADEATDVERILSYMGNFGLYAEEYMNAVTCVAGSGPAFVYKFIRGLRDSAMDCGISEKEALDMAISTVLGTCVSLRNTVNPDLTEMINAVCSKGGTTIAGITTLDEKNFEEILKSGINSAIKRAEEISNERCNDIH